MEPSRLESSRSKFINKQRKRQRNEIFEQGRMLMLQQRQPREEGYSNSHEVYPEDNIFQEKEKINEEEIYKVGKAVKQSIVAWQRSGINSQLKQVKKKQYEIYSCFRCLKDREQRWRWETRVSFEDHLQYYHHQERPQLYKIMKEVNQKNSPEKKTLQWSHAYFNGKLINLQKSIDNHEDNVKSYLFQEGRYQQLYFCSCKLNKNKPNSFSFFFYEPSSYIHHYIRNHNDGYQKGNKFISHRVIQKEKQYQLVRNEQFSTQNISERYQLEVNKIRRDIVRQKDLLKQHILNKNRYINIIKLLKQLPQQQYNNVKGKKYYICCICNIRRGSKNGLKKCQHTQKEIEEHRSKTGTQKLIDIFLAQNKLSDDKQELINYRKDLESEQDEVKFLQHLQIIENILWEGIHICGECLWINYKKNRYKFIEHIIQKNHFSQINSHTLSFQSELLSE